MTTPTLPFPIHRGSLAYLVADISLIPFQVYIPCHIWFRFYGTVTLVRSLILQTNTSTATPVHHPFPTAWRSPLPQSGASLRPGAWGLPVSSRSSCCIFHLWKGVLTPSLSLFLSPAFSLHLSWAGGDVLVGCLLYWLLTTRLEAACYLNWTHSSRESQTQGSAVGEWRVDSWVSDGREVTCHTGIIQ